MAAVFADLDALGVPLAGVFHAAGNLDDAILPLQTPERFRAVTAAKLAGAWNLHRLCAGRPLEHFVLFSSMVAVLGNQGQANHAAANAFLDALAHLRRRQGLPALAVNWGGWSTIGAVVTQRVGERLAAIGLGPIPPRDGIAALDWLLSQGDAQCGVVPIQWGTFLEHWGRCGDAALYARFRTLARARVAGVAAPAGGERKGSAGGDLLAALTRMSPEARRPRLAEEVALHTARVLGLDGPQAVDRQRGFFTLGLDSLTTVELRNRLQTALGTRLPATLAFDYPDVDKLAAYLDGKLFPAPAAEPEETALGQAVAAMGDAEAEAELLRELEELGK
jgi:acyl carrier protein